MGPRVVPREGPCLGYGDTTDYSWKTEFGEGGPLPEILLEELGKYAAYPGGRFREWYGVTSAT